MLNILPSSCEMAQTKMSRSERVSHAGSHAVAHGWGCLRSMLVKQV